MSRDSSKALQETPQGLLLLTLTGSEGTENPTDLSNLQVNGFWLTFQQHIYPPRGGGGEIGTIQTLMGRGVLTGGTGASDVSGGGKAPSAVRL